ncbi:hypothetical protein [Lacimicrobium sp. SS2-24]|uniref:hypothetical protein n=1 Tax=Lacimicrobium sp. SS2-24 TaxID=2005569 RepID=UPI000B4BA307|nr:hypothetical protein [Lacimicrobium sp. SS2-24]
MQIDTVVASGKALDRRDLFHYIHQDHSDLMSRIDDIIAARHASGELKNLIAAAEQQVMQQGSADTGH